MFMVVVMVVVTVIIVVILMVMIVGTIVNPARFMVVIVGVPKQMQSGANDRRQQVEKNGQPKAPPPGSQSLMASGDVEWVGAKVHCR